MRGKNTKAQEKNKNYKMILFTGPSTHTLIYITHPPSIPSPPSLVIKIQFFFLTRFYFTKIRGSHDSRGNGRLSFKLFSTTSTSFTDT